MEGELQQKRAFDQLFMGVDSGRSKRGHGKCLPSQHLSAQQTVRDKESRRYIPVERLDCSFAGVADP